MGKPPTGSPRSLSSAMGVPDPENRQSDTKIIFESLGSPLSGSGTPRQSTASIAEMSDLGEPTGGFPMTYRLRYSLGMLAGG